MIPEQHLAVSESRGWGVEAPAGINQCNQSSLVRGTADLMLGQFMPAEPSASNCNFKSSESGMFSCATRNRQRGFSDLHILVLAFRWVKLLIGEVICQRFVPREAVH